MSMAYFSITTTFALAVSSMTEITVTPAGTTKWRVLSARINSSKLEDDAVEAYRKKTPLLIAVTSMISVEALSVMSVADEIVVSYVTAIAPVGGVNGIISPF